MHRTRGCRWWMCRLPGLLGFLRHLAASCLRALLQVTLASQKEGCWPGMTWVRCRRWIDSRSLRFEGPAVVWSVRAHGRTCTRVVAANSVIAGRSGHIEKVGRFEVDAVMSRKLKSRGLTTRLPAVGYAGPHRRVWRQQQQASAGGGMLTLMPAQAMAPPSVRGECGEGGLPRSLSDAAYRSVGESLP